VVSVDETGKKTYTSTLPFIYENMKVFFTDERIPSLLYALLMIVFYWMIVYVLDKKKVYIKV
jgi:predicted acyltransferase